MVFCGVVVVFLWRWCFCFCGSVLVFLRWKCADVFVVVIWWCFVVVFGGSVLW